MKICLISVHFLETTFPLAKHLADKNIEVTLFCLLPFAHRKSNVIDFTKYTVRHGIDNRFNDKVYNPNLKNYLKKIQLNSFFFSSIRSNPFANLIHAIKLRSLIKKQNFDIVHIIGSTPYILLLYALLGKICKVHTLHEVTVHEENLPIFKYHGLLLNILCKKDIKVILHSEISLNRLSIYYDSLHGKKSTKEGRFFNIPFGLFETFYCFNDGQEVLEEKNTILFFGRIIPYKGIYYLIEALETLKLRIPNIKLIIAGEGDLETSVPQDTMIEIHNEFIPNEKLITLIKRAKIIICPYISASQSGIPMVAFLFGKPVIATNVGGFPEIIDHMKTGMIVPPKNSYALAQAIEELLTKEGVLDELKNNISDKYKSSFSWKSIAERTITVYNKCIHN